MPKRMSSPIGSPAAASATPSNHPLLDSSQSVDAAAAEQNSPDPLDPDPESEHTTSTSTTTTISTTEPAHDQSDSTKHHAPSEHYKSTSDTGAVAKPCDDTHTHEPPHPSPGGDHTASGASEIVVGEQHAGSEQVIEQAAVVSESEQEISESPEATEAPRDDTKSKAFVYVDEGEPSSVVGHSRAEALPTVKPDAAPVQTTNLPVMSAVSEVSALSDRPDMASVHPGQNYVEEPFYNTGFAAAPLDDEAAAAAGAAALAFATPDSPDAGKRSKKEKSHRKKEKSSDGAERPKEKKHRDRAKSRDRSDRTRDRSTHIDGTERSHRDRAKSRERLGRAKSRDRLDGSKDKSEKKHRTPEEKAEREARKAAKRGNSTPAPLFTDNVTAEPFETSYEPQYDQQYEEERHQDEKRKQKKVSKHSTPAPAFVEPAIFGSPQIPYEQPVDDRSREKKKSKKPRPPPITIEPHAQPYDPETPHDDPIKRRKSSKSKAAALLGEPITSAMEGHQGPMPTSPYFDGPIEQPKRKKSSKKTNTDGVEIEPVHVVYEPHAEPPKSSRHRRSNSTKPEGGSGSGSGGDKDKGRGHQRKDSAHLTPEERDERRRKHEEKALRKGKELEDHLRNGSKEDRRAEKVARKAAKAKAEARENIPAPPFTPYDLPIQIPEDNHKPRHETHEGSQLRSPYLHHRDEQDGALLSPRRERPGEPPLSARSARSGRSFADEDAAKADKARRRAERRARKEQEPEVVKDSGHSLSSEGKREHRDHSKKHKSSKTRVPGTPEEEEARRARKEEKREARRLAALDGGEQKGDGRPEGKVRKQRENGDGRGHRESGGSGRARPMGERNQQKEMYKEMEIGAPVGYGSHSQTPWMAGAQQVDEEEKRGVMRSLKKLLKF